MALPIFPAIPYAGKSEEIPLRHLEGSAEVSGCLLGSLSLEVAGQSADLRAKMNWGITAWQSAIAALLREAMQVGALPKSSKPMELAGRIIDHWEGAHVRAKALQTDEPFHSFMRFTFDVLLKYQA